MELGNLIFGHSRGEYQIPRTDAFESPMFDLMDTIQKDCSPYGTDFENDVFTMSRYWWGDCSCGADAEDMSDEYIVIHKSDCGLVRPNFFYKPTGYKLMWYKYAMRDAYANQKLTPKQFREMMDKCIESVKVTV